MIISRLKTLAFTTMFAGLMVVPALSETTTVKFNVSLGIAKLGEMHVSADIDGESYSATGRLFTSGLAGAMYNLNYVSASQGVIGDDGGFQPELYTNIAQEKGRKTTVRIEYDDGVVSSVTFKPSAKIPADAIGQADAVDPMTLIYMLIKPVPTDQVCVGSFDVFDGKRRSSVSFTGLRRLNNGRIECSVNYSGGKSGSISISGLVFMPNSDGMAYIKQFSVDTAAGKLVARIK